MRTNRDDRYFTDTYQAMPLHGYTRMFERMLAHPNIKVMLNTDYREIEDIDPVRRDDLHRADRRVLRLPLRQAAVPLARVPVRDARPRRRFQAAPVVNYPNEHAYTRVTEFKYLTGQEHPKTSVVYEYPEGRGRSVLPGAAARERRALPAVPGAGRAHAAACTSSAGSATYKYYNMDQVVAQALTLYAQAVAARRPQADRA